MIAGSEIVISAADSEYREWVIPEYGNRWVGHTKVNGLTDGPPSATEDQPHAASSVRRHSLSPHRLVTITFHRWKSASSLSPPRRPPISLFQFTALLDHYSPPARHQNSVPLPSLPHHPLAHHHSLLLRHLFTTTSPQLIAHHTPKPVATIHTRSNHQAQ